MKKELILLLSVGLLFSACGKKQNTSARERDYPVMVTQRNNRTLKTGYAATIKGKQTVEVRPQISGKITKILINEGDIVKKGELLFVIDQTAYKAAYEIAVANVQSAEASLSTAELVLESNKDLYKQNVVSEFDITTAQNDLKAARAKLALAKAEEVSARNNLSFTEVRSPVNGVASMIPYRVGALVSSSVADPLVTVSDDSEVYAYFSMAERQVLNLIQKYGSLQKAIRQMPEVELQMSNGKIYKYKGHIDAVSGTIGNTTGAVSLRAVFPNPERLLREGGSGTVVIPTFVENSIVIPQAATFELQDRIFVYKVVNGRAVSQEIIVLDQNNGNEYIVESGLHVGDSIISEGAGLVREGTVVHARSGNGKKTENTNNK